MNLKDFTVPNDGEIPVCEVNDRVQCMKETYANVNSYTSALKDYPEIFITRDQLHPISSRDEGRALFLPVDVPFLKQLTQIYYEQGLVEALHTASAHRNIFISRSANIALDVVKYINKLRLIFNPNIRYTIPSLIQEYCQTRDWSNHTIRNICWHPHCRKVAIVTCDDVVRIYSDKNTNSLLLRCRQQKNITCVAWRPMCLTEIAVGHENGIIVWNIDSNSMVVRPSLSNTIILHRTNHTPVISISWSPKGDKLASVASCDTTILIWDVNLDKTGSLKGSGGIGNVLIKWSPMGELLISCSNSLVFRIWNCCDWHSERWTVQSGRVQSACWMKNKRIFFFATNSEPMIYALTFDNNAMFVLNTENELHPATPLTDVTKIDIDGIIVGGLVQAMECDPNGKRLAVMFQDTNLVAIFNIIVQPQLQLLAGSLVMGLPEEKPSTINFIQDFEQGTCLCIGWSSGRMQYYPIIYTDLAPVNNRNNASLYNSLNGFTY